MPVDPDRPVSSTAKVPIDIRRLPWMRRLAVDYVHRFDALASFYAGNPAERRAWGDAIARATTQARDRAGLVAVLGRQLAGRQSPPRAQAAAARLLDPRSVAIVTGQQAGLFGGPLYTLLKAVTAVIVAERVEREHHVPAVPVFWVESEDHDWNEVQSCAVLGTDRQRRTVTLPPPPGAGERPVASVPLDASVTAAVDELRGTLPATEFTDTLIERLSAAYRPGTTMSTAFGRWLDTWLGAQGLVVYDSADPASKALAADVFVRALEHPTMTASLAASSGARLVECGYHAQVEPRPDSVGLFRLEGTRRPIHYRDGAFVIDDRRVAPAALIDQARRSPEAFSPNVLLRPLVQDTLFPTVCYVAGPNELAYLAQLRQIYEQFEVPEPLMLPRATATLLDAAAMRFLERSQIPFEALQPDTETALNALLARQVPAAVEEVHADTARAVAGGMTRLIAALPALDATLVGAAQATLGRMQHDLGALHAKMVQAAKRRDDTVRRQYARTRALAFPDAQPQERAIGLVAFVNQHGPALIDRLLVELAPDPGTHWVLAFP